MRSKRRPPPAAASKGITEHRINRRIRIPKVQLIDQEGVNHGEIDTDAALRLAEAAGLDLVEVSPTARPPVCKIMNYGQYKYELKKRQKGTKAHQAKVKGVRLHPNTAEHDIQVALKKSVGFMDKGDKVLIQIWFKGRELAHTERGEELLKRFIDELKDVSKIESPIRREGKRMHLLLTPMTPEERNARKKVIEREKEKAAVEAIARAKEAAAQKAAARQPKPEPAKEPAKEPEGAGSN